MEGSAESAVEKYLELSNKHPKTLTKVATPCIDDHLLAAEDFETKGILSEQASRIVLKALYLARLARPDILWAVNTLAREVTQWNIASDKRLHRLISYLHHTKDHVMTSFVGDYAHECKLMMFCDASFAGDLRDSKSTSGGILVLVGPNTFAPICWTCKKQGAVSHSSTESEAISLDTCLRLDGLPAMDFWDIVINVMHPEFAKPITIDQRKPNILDKLNESYRIFKSIDNTPTIKEEIRRNAKLVILEDNEAVIKMCNKGRSPNMRHVQRTHRVNLDFLFQIITKDPNISILYVNTKEQLADIFTKGSFTASTWNVLLKLIQIGNILPDLKTPKA